MEAQTKVQFQLRSAVLDEPRWLHNLDPVAMEKEGAAAEARRYEEHCVELWRLAECEGPRLQGAIVAAKVTA